MKYLSKTQEVDLFWLRGTVQKLGIELKKVGTADNLADVLTKPLCGPRTAEMRKAVGVAGDVHPRRS